MVIECQSRDFFPDLLSSRRSCLCRRVDYANGEALSFNAADRRFQGRLDDIDNALGQCFCVRTHHIRVAL